MEKNKNQSRLSGRQERYIQPSILMGLLSKPCYGYELINTIHLYGFIQGQAPPGMIYRHLRRLEEDGLVTSQWDTTDAGAAKRMYTITGEGREVLSIWVDYMDDQAGRLQRFVAMYQENQE
jgi:poly-beta-hydroxybutyrate-responsive repressor